MLRGGNLVFIFFEFKVRSQCISFADEYVYKCFKQTGNHEELLNYVESHELETHIDST